MQRSLAVAGGLLFAFAVHAADEPAGAAAPAATDTAQAPPAAAPLPAGPAQPTAPSVVLDVENAEKLQGIHRVVIPSFMVEYVTEAKGGTQIDGIAMFAGAPSNAVIKLKGADPERFQPIADALYEQTVAELEKSGIEVVPLDKLKESATYKEIAAKGETAPREESAKGGKGMFYTAKELPLYYMDEVAFIPPKMQININPFNKPKPKVDSFLTFGTRIGSAFSTATIPALEQKLAQELDATAMKVRITILGGSVQVDHSFWTGSTVSIKGAGAFAPMVTRYAFVKSNGDRARVSLKEALSTGELGELVNVTSATSKTLDTARNALTVAQRLMPLAGVQGGVDMGYGHSVDYEWRVEPAAFEQMLKSSYEPVSQSFTGKLVEMRGS